MYNDLRRSTKDIAQMKTRTKSANDQPYSAVLVLSAHCINARSHGSLVIRAQLQIPCGLYRVLCTSILLHNMEFRGLTKYGKMTRRSTTVVLTEINSPTVSA